MFPQRSKGSHTTHIDLDLSYNLWTKTRPPEPVIEPIPVDENGVDMRLCSHCGKYVKRAGFRKDSGRPSGLDAVCRDCRHLQYIRDKATSFATEYRT